MTGIKPHRALSPATKKAVIYLLYKIEIINS